MRARPGASVAHARDKQLAAISIDRTEIEKYRFAEPAEAATRLSGPVRGRVLATIGSKRCVYLEKGRRVKGLRS